MNCQRHSHRSSLHHPRVFGLDELPVHMSRKAELARLVALVRAGDASAIRTTVAANGLRQIDYSVAAVSETEHYVRALVDFGFPLPPSDEC